MRGAAVLAIAAAVQLLPASPASASSAPAESPGCETYGCLYEHCPTHYSRGGDADCAYGVAYQRLPDGPDGRRFVGVQWPGHYDPARRHMWDEVAYCESTWRWGYDGASGFDGGLQFTPSTWRAYGGHEYAQYAYQATPEQQIDIAERVAFHGHAGNGPQGRGAWPHCGHHVSAP
ncbi:transglycosylase family protein [Euzebya sp.]|uniref:transglycosylase family protein n=1 Tax=Euzebya sp. TaxID=1971409 RepID=UPI0035131C28